MKKLSMIGIVGWCRVIGGGALVASVVASGPCGATANGVTR
jgi:hypothetical protein